MLHVRKFHDLGELNARTARREAADAALIGEASARPAERYPSLGQTEKTARLAQLIQSGAWTDAALGPDRSRAAALAGAPPRL